MAMKTVEVVVLPDGRMDPPNAGIYLGRSEKTLAQWRSRGTGPKFIKRGRVWYRRSDLDSWLAGGEAASCAAAHLTTAE